ncbi:DUF916 and DUF3324 domain-containing protein [Enterococcus sp. LJL99]
MLPQTSFAEDSSTTDPLGFTVEAIQPSTQIDKDKSYFYLKTQPGVEQKVQVKVTGTSPKPVKVKAYVSNAITSESGTINYIPEIEKNKTLTNSIEEIATVDAPEFEISDGEEKLVTITIKTPQESYDGIKLGTVYFKRIDQEETKQTSQVKSEYSYRIGICLSESEKVYNDGQSLNLTKATPELFRTQKAILLTFENPEPKMITDLKMKIKIIDNKNGKVVKKQELENGAMAPNTAFDYAVDWGIESIPSGKYTAQVEATSKHKSWDLEKEFEISAEQAKKMNKDTLYKLFLPNWAYIVTIILGIVTIGFSIALSLRNKKWAQMKKNKRKKSTKQK